MKITKISNFLVPILLISGCEMAQRAQAPRPTPPEPPSTPATVTPDPGQKIDRLLHEAEIAFRDNRLTTPLDDNAYYRYLRILTLDPDNEQAEDGIASIVEKYLEWAMANAERGQFRSAISYLNKAKSVDRSHPNIDAVDAFITEKRSASRMTFRLSPAGVDQQAPRVIQELHEIGREVARQGARVVIVGRTDAEGRWIYQQLNDATPDRVRAEFEPGGHPLVRLIY